MISIKDFLEATQYKITGGAEYLWKCFGENVRFLDCENDAYSASIVFDTLTQEVYIAEVWDYEAHRQYKLINPEFKDVYIKENESKNLDYTNALDNSKFIVLETDEDFLEKATAIVAREHYDTRIQVPLTLSDDEMFQLMKMAHEHDRTLNQMVEHLLRAVIEKEFSDA